MHKNLVKKFEKYLHKKKHRRIITLKRLVMKKIKPKKCAVCGGEFVPYLTTQKVCGVTCAISSAKKETEKKEAKEWSEEKKVRKEKLKTHKDWLQDLQKVFNAYIRERDRMEPCISCGTVSRSIKYDAGHFFTVGGFPNVRFDEDNCHKQCSNNCNFKKSGNIQEYRPRLIQKIGPVGFAQLEIRARNTVLKLSIPEIKDKIEYYRNLIKNLKQK